MHHNEVRRGRFEKIWGQEAKEAAWGFGATAARSAAAVQATSKAAPAAAAGSSGPVPSTPGPVTEAMPSSAAAQPAAASAAEDITMAVTGIEDSRGRARE